MREIKDIEADIIKAQEDLDNVDQMDLIKYAIMEDRVYNLKKELENAKKKPKVVSEVSGLPKGRYKYEKNKIGITAARVRL